MIITVRFIENMEGWHIMSDQSENSLSICPLSIFIILYIKIVDLPNTNGRMRGPIKCFTLDMVFWAGYYSNWIVQWDITTYYGCCVRRIYNGWMDVLRWIDGWINFCFRCIAMYMETKYGSNNRNIFAYGRVTGVVDQNMSFHQPSQYCMAFLVWSIFHIKIAIPIM